MMVKIAKSDSDSWGSFEKDMMSQLGLSDERENDADADDELMPATVDTSDEATAAYAASAGIAPADVKPTPRSGKTAWGRWSHEDEAVELDITLPEGTRAKELICEVSKAGVLRVETKGAAVLTGNLVLPVDRTELAWAIEEQDDGSKLLCLELPMLPIDTSSRLTSVDCIFDSLKVEGDPCVLAGLSGADGKA